jgi:hypothetical protein
MICSKGRLHSATFLIVGSLLSSVAGDAYAQEEAEMEKIVADQIRSQGFVCTNPATVERVEAESTPDEPVYLLKCEDATYQVRLVPDQAARIVQVK